MAPEQFDYGCYRQAWGHVCGQDRAICVHASTAYLRDDRLVIKCDVTVFTETSAQVEMPPSEKLEQLGKLFKTKEGAYVAFDVGGEVFAVHKIILANRHAVAGLQSGAVRRDQGQRAAADLSWVMAHGGHRRTRSLLALIDAKVVGSTHIQP